MYGEVNIKRKFYLYLGTIFIIILGQSMDGRNYHA